MDHADEWEWRVSPYADWAGRLDDPEGGPDDDGEAEPRVVRLPGAPCSEDRVAWRARVLAEAAALRLDPHERALLREAHDHERTPPCEADDRPDLVPDDEVFVAHVDPAEVFGADAAALAAAALGRRARARGACPPPIPDAPPEEDGAYDDAPVVVVIDDAVAFLNRRFRAPCGRRTRIDAVWMQAPRPLAAWPWGGTAPPLTHAGAVLRASDIDALLARGPALDEEAAYRRLSRALHRPGRHRTLERGLSHGTHVADLAAGADPDDPAVRWPMLAVCLPPATLDHSAGHYLEPSIVAGLRWALWRARRLGRGPVIVNLSLGELAGPKDGSRPIERATAAEVARFEAATGRPAYLNWAFGNARLGRRAAEVRPGRHDERLVWRLQPDDRAASYLEVHGPDDAPWTDALADLSLEVTLPDGETRAVAAPPPWRARRVAPGLALYHVGTADGGRAHLVLAAGPTIGPDRTPAGRHRLRVLRGGRPAACRVEVQRGDTPLGFRASGRQSYLEHPEGHAFDRETGAWLASPAGPIGLARTHSSFLTARSARVLSTGAARPDRAAGARPAPFAAEGGGAVPGPSISALSEGGVGVPGIVAGGTLSGSARRLGGSSAATGMASRALAQALSEGWEGMPPDAAALARRAVAGGLDGPGAEAGPDPRRDPRLGAGTVARAGRRIV